jgi:hypothetical protein
LVRLSAECVQGIRNRTNHKVEGLAALIPKLMPTPPFYIEQPSGRIHAPLHRRQMWCRSLSGCRVVRGHIAHQPTQQPDESNPIIISVFSLMGLFNIIRFDRRLQDIATAKIEAQGTDSFRVRCG